MKIPVASAQFSKHIIDFINEYPGVKDVIQDFHKYMLTYKFKFIQYTGHSDRMIYVDAYLQYYKYNKNKVHSLMNDDNLSRVVLEHIALISILIVNWIMLEMNLDETLEDKNTIDYNSLIHIYLDKILVVYITNGEINNINIIAKNINII